MCGDKLIFICTIITLSSIEIQGIDGPKLNGFTTMYFREKNPFKFDPFIPE